MSGWGEGLAGAKPLAQSQGSPHGGKMLVLCRERSQEKLEAAWRWGKGHCRQGAQHGCRQLLAGGLQVAALHHAV